MKGSTFQIISYIELIYLLFYKSVKAAGICIKIADSEIVLAGVINIQIVRGVTDITELLTIRNKPFLGGDLKAKHRLEQCSSKPIMGKTFTIIPHKLF
jgi:hypothetical protein